MLIVGALLILAGLGWGVWVRVNAPPPPTITDAGRRGAGRDSADPGADGHPAPTTPTATDTPRPAARPPAHPAPKVPRRSCCPIGRPCPTRPNQRPPPCHRRPLPTPTPSPRPRPLPPAQEPPTPHRRPGHRPGRQGRAHGLGDGRSQRRHWSSEWIVPTKAAGWHMNSALPGHTDNVVLSGHHNIEGKVFRYVVDLEPGDETHPLRRRHAVSLHRHRKVYPERDGHVAQRAAEKRPVDHAHRATSG